MLSTLAIALGAIAVICQALLAPRRVPARVRVSENQTPANADSDVA